MSSISRVRAGAFLLASIVVVAVIGYMILEQVSPFQALYMTVITISTVGYGEEFVLSQGGKLFTLGVIIVGVGTGLYTAGAALEVALENLGGRRNRRMERQIAALEDHFIVCGFGRVGRGTWEALLERRAEVVVVEQDEDRAEDAREAGVLVVEGDATHNDTLEAAGIQRARALVACVRGDSDNLVIVLSAKALRPDLLVVSRATEMEWRGKLLLAGADRVVAPQQVGADRLAALALQPALAEFLDLVVSGRMVEFRIEEVRVGSDSDVANKTLRDALIRERSGALILAIETTQDRLLINPDPDLVLLPGQLVVGIGTDEQVRRLGDLIAGG